MTAEEIEDKIREYFEENYELMRLETGHALGEAPKAEALDQVIFYYQKMAEIAERVTDTEVRLTLPDQRSPKGRPFNIEGIVDIVREDDEVWMYDIKTHDPDFVRDNSDLYEKQLNVYAYIWSKLRGNALTGTAIIATPFPKAMKRAWAERRMADYNREFQKWDPLIKLAYDTRDVEETIEDFGKIVDAIEDHLFAPPDDARLQQEWGRTKQKFGTVVCRNCDGRFSCGPHRVFTLGGNARSTSHFRQYIATIAADAEAQEEFMTGALVALADRTAPEDD